MKKIIKITINTCLALYFLATLALFFLQRSMVFVPNINVPNIEIAQMPALEILHIPTEDDLLLLSWYKPADKDYPTILYFQGNAGNLETQSHLTLPIYNSPFGLLMVEYRGYGGNEGEPTETGFYKDGRAGLKYLNNLGIKNKEIILYGRSLGTGTATQMATEIEARGLILQAPFTAIYAVGEEQYPLFPIKLLARDKFDSLSKIKSVTEPLLIFWGDKDKTVPPHMPAELFEAANNPKQKLIILGGGHSDIFDKGGNEAVMSFLEELY
ncbi:MAG: alpha/beta hydrolase [Sphingomonadales bacterium]